MLCVRDLLEYESKHSAAFDGRVVYGEQWLAPSSGESEYFAGRLAKF